MENMPFLHNIIFYVLLLLCMLEGLGRILGKKGLGVKAGKKIIRGLINLLALVFREGGKVLLKLAKSIK